MSRRIGEAATNLSLVVVAISCAVATYHVVRRPTVSPATPPVRQVSEWRDVAVGANRIGPKTAEITITEFSDFQCPYCRQAHDVLALLIAKHPGTVRIIYRHSPIKRIHPFAEGAAIASECAGTQGRFQAFHDKLFELQDSIGRIEFSQFASMSGVPDMDQFKKCLTEDGPKQRVDADLEAGKLLGLRGTPTLLVNGTLFSGSPPLETLDSTVRAKLREMGEVKP